MALTKVPSHTGLTDQQFIQVTGPDQILSGFAYDAQTRSLFAKESQVILPSFHGVTHVGEDPVPNATCDTPGLLAADDKCKLDALIQTRVGVLGFQGAGFPDDGGWMQGDIIFAAGSEFISLERIGNVVRFTVDNPIPLNCDCESCAQIFWVQDETEVSAIRPPSCAGKLPGVNAYGEMKIYLMPESTLVDPSNPAAVLATKGQFPSLIFKRFDDSITPGQAEIDIVLRRDPNNAIEASVGWAMTPGAGTVAECVWFMGEDDNGNRMRFELEPKTNPGLLGHLLYKGHLLTKAMASIVDYTPQVLSTNQYVLKFWDVDNSVVVGDTFTATNNWRFENPEGPTSGVDAKALILDRTCSLLQIGTLVDVWFFQIGEIAGDPQRRYYFRQQPKLLAKDLWDNSRAAEFGDTITARRELSPSLTDSTDKTSSEQVSSIRHFEKDEWGLTGFDNPLILFEDAETGGPTEILELNDQHRAVIDLSLPGLKVEAADGPSEPFSERPVYLWNRTNMSNMLATVEIGRPPDNEFPPYDILLKAPIDSHDNVYLRTISTGTFIDSTDNYIIVKGAHFNDLPNSGVLRILTAPDRNKIWEYSSKLVFPSLDDDGVALVGTDAFPGTIGDVSELLHQEFNAPCVRLEFDLVGATWQLQFKVGELDMSTPYDEDASDDVDDYVRGLKPGYTVSSVYTQDGTFDGTGTQPSTNFDGYVLYDGGAVFGGSQPEFWNELEVLYRDGQIWIWWNDLIIPPNGSLSGALTTPVAITTPFYPVTAPLQYGKFGVRMFPGAKLRRAQVRGQNRLFSEFTRGQLELA